MGSKTTSAWLQGNLISFAEDLILLQPMKLYVKWIAMSFVIYSEVKSLIQQIIKRSRLVMLRSSGLMRSADAMIHHLNPACRAARHPSLVKLSTSLLLISLNDDDIPRELDLQPMERLNMLQRVVIYFLVLLRQLPEDGVDIFYGTSANVLTSLVLIFLGLLAQYSIFIPISIAIVIFGVPVVHYWRKYVNYSYHTFLQEPTAVDEILDVEIGVIRQHQNANASERTMQSRTRGMSPQSHLTDGLDHIRRKAVAEQKMGALQGQSKSFNPRKFLEKFDSRFGSMNGMETGERHVRVQGPTAKEEWNAPELWSVLGATTFRSPPTARSGLNTSRSNTQNRRSAGLVVIEEEDEDLGDDEVETKSDSEDSKDDDDAAICFVVTNDDGGHGDVGEVEGSRRSSPPYSSFARGRRPATAQVSMRGIYDDLNEDFVVHTPVGENRDRYFQESNSRSSNNPALAEEAADENHVPTVGVEQWLTDFDDTIDEPSLPSDTTVPSLQNDGSQLQKSKQLGWKMSKAVSTRQPLNLSLIDDDDGNDERTEAIEEGDEEEVDEVNVVSRQYSVGSDASPGGIVGHLAHGQDSDSGNDKSDKNTSMRGRLNVLLSHVSVDFNLDEQRRSSRYQGIIRTASTSSSSSAIVAAVPPRLLPPPPPQHGVDVNESSGADAVHVDFVTIEMDASPLPQQCDVEEEEEISRGNTVPAGAGNGGNVVENSNAQI